MEEFILLICWLLFIAFVQKGAEALLDRNGLKSYKTIVSVTCIIACYIAVGRFFYMHLLEELFALVGLTQ